MKNEKTTHVDGEVLQSLPNTMFKISLTDGRVILATPAGRLRRGFVRIFPGNRVKVEFTQYDKERGRIVAKY